MDNEGKKILEDEVESIMQSIPEWVKYIPQNDEIRMQISAIYHAVHGYTHKRKEDIGEEICSIETAEDVHKYTHEEGTIIDKEYFTKFFDLAAQYNIFSGKIRGWSKPKDDYSLSDYVDERNRLRSVEKSILLLISEIKADNERTKSNQTEKVLREQVHKALSERDAMKKKMSGRQTITQKEAAEIVGYTERTIKNWDHWIGRPKWYEGRNMSREAFIGIWRKAMEEEKKEMEIKKALKHPFSLEALAEKRVRRF